MNTATPAIRDFARRLIALEAARDGSPGVLDGGAGRVCDRLRVPLARLAGVAGFRSLLSRALALAKSEVDSLNTVQVREDGSLEGFDGAGGLPGGGPGGDGGAVVVAHLLGLMVTFIGELLTRQLVRDLWPDAATGETDGRAGGQL
jgi:hypothetical protein